MEVKIVHLEPMQVASFSAYSENPEEEAWEKMIAWARPLGLLADPQKHRIFGFDTTGGFPEDGNKRGYEFWLELEPGDPVGDDVKVQQFLGGQYAVYRIPKVGNPWLTIPPAWENLARWQRSSPYEMGDGPCLEQHIGHADEPMSEAPMDLFLSIA